MEHSALVEVYKLGWGLLIPFSAWLVMKIFSLEKTLAVLQTAADSREKHIDKMLALMAKNHEASVETSKSLRAQLAEHSKAVSDRLNSIDAHLRNGKTRA